MKKLIILLVTCIYSLATQVGAQPANDNCSTALNAANVLTVGSAYKCSPGGAQMGMATVEAGEYTGCFTPAPVGTTWFSFIADQANMWIAVKPNGSLCGTTNGSIPSSWGLAVYNSNTCYPNSPAACLNYYSANNSAANWSQYSKLNLTGLAIGSTYMVQVAWYASCVTNAWKPFCIAIGHPSTCNICSNPCGPLCNFNQPTSPPVPTITSTCPASPPAPPMNIGDSQTKCFTFIATNTIMNLQMIIQSYCNPNVFSASYTLQTSSCGAIISGGPLVAGSFPPMTPLVVGQQYTLCYTWTAACSQDTIWPYVWGNSTLPVELLDLDAIALRDRNKIFWSTASEENAEEFIVERTVNGKDFTEIARVKASGNSTTVQNYEAFDESPLVGDNYYRLKQIDFNGEFTYTKLVSAKFSLTQSGVEIIPNPSNDHAVVKFNSENIFQTYLKISSVNGVVVSDEKFNSTVGINEHSMDVSKFAKGIYFLQFISGNQIVTEKFVKN